VAETKPGITDVKLLFARSGNPRTSIHLGKAKGTPRRAQSVPRAAFGVAMLTLLRRRC
jgi:hypothetical protein